ncbi:hypothetical protein BU17DRAFT_75584 [Hysterangium stoloniferum]|nr:hypothetical protein BU17DRAFT_75584 [Hysterangium stoloniferum]
MEFRYTGSGWVQGSDSKFSREAFELNKLPHNRDIDLRASAKLWVDAEAEETQDETPTPKSMSYRDKAANIAQSYPNWAGDESTPDAVLRMLVDKYKPLRGEVKTADEKIKNMKIDVATIPTNPPPLLIQESTSPPPLTPEHKPWLTTFKIPSHTSSSIRYMRLPPAPPPSKRPPHVPIHPDDTRTRIVERDRRRKEAYAGKIVGAKEGSLDYRLGVAGRNASAGRPGGGPPNPVSMKGWAGLVEERIERARSEGHFSKLKGRGKPLEREIEQSNPFISREEFLMNRIVKRQGAVPVWVEYQTELDTALSTFRATLHTNWTRRAIRSFTTQLPPSLLHTVSAESVRTLRDPAWESLEKGYHDRAIAEINKLMRKYNGVAPYPVRRVEIIREREMQKMYEACWAGVLEGVSSRASGSKALQVNGVGDEDEGRGRVGSGIDAARFSTGHGFGWKAMWERWVDRFVSAKSRC